MPEQETARPRAAAMRRSPLTLDQCGETLDANTLAAVLGISRRTLDVRRQHGEAPEPLPMPGHPRWSKEQVRKFLAGDVRATRGFRRRF